MKTPTPPPHLYEYQAEVVSVYDGDTIRVDIDLGFRTWIRNTSVRLLGIDAPEIRGETRETGLISRDRLREVLVPGRQVMLRTEQDKTGKYGRWLAEVYVWSHALQWESVNVWMVDHGLARRAEY